MKAKSDKENKEIKKEIEDELLEFEIKENNKDYIQNNEPKIKNTKSNIGRIKEKDISKANRIIINSFKQIKKENEYIIKTFLKMGKIIIKKKV